MVGLEDGNVYLRLLKMSHTIYTAKFEQTIIHQHVHLRRESQSHAPAYVLMRLHPINKSLVFFAKRKKDVMWEYFVNVWRRLLCNAKWANFQLYHGENKLYLISMRWWCPLCTRSTRFVGFAWCLLTETTVCMLLHSDTLSWFWTNCSYSLMMHALRRSSKCQFYNLWFDPTRTRTHNLPYSKRAR